MPFLQATTEDGIHWNIEPTESDEWGGCSVNEQPLYPVGGEFGERFHAPDLKAAELRLNLGQGLSHAQASALWGDRARLGDDVAEQALRIIDLERQCNELYVALEVYADPRNWAISRDDQFRHPTVNWIGPGSTQTPVPDAPKVAREALT